MGSDMWSRIAFVVLLMAHAVSVARAEVVAAPPAETPAPASGSGTAPPPGASPAASPPPVVENTEAAQRDRLAAALTVNLGGGGRNWFFAALGFEVGATIPELPIRVRARGFGVIAGGTMESDWGGDFSRWGGGIEVRRCTRSELACAFVDLDAGFQKLTLYDHGGEFVRADRGPFAGPRIGFDAGLGIRFRLAIEWYRHFTRDSAAYTGRGVMFGLGAQF